MGKICGPKGIEVTFETAIDDPIPRAAPSIHIFLSQKNIRDCHGIVWVYYIYIYD
jgi:hypothetical protein